MKIKRSLALTKYLCATLCAFGAVTGWAETVLVESRTTGGTTGGITPNPPYGEVAGSWSGSGSHTTADGVTSGIGSRFGFTSACSLAIRPTLIPSNTYALEVAHIIINASPDLVVNVTYDGCTGTASNTTAFNNTISPSAWVRVGTVTVNDGVTQPTITFTYASGTIASTGGRWYSDAFRFVNLAEPCVTALPQLTTVNGPLAAGQTFVDVPGISGSAIAVTVYANGIQIGEKTSGVSNGVNRVTVSPLVKGQIISATQKNASNVDSCRPSGGPIVGGGANPTLHMALSIRQNTVLTGPIGANGGASNTIIKFLGATNTIAGLGTAPAGAKVITPSASWQTVTFLRGPDPAAPTDPSFLWNGTDATNPNQLKGDFGVLDSIAFSMNEADSGPYEVYIDNFMNGDTLIQDFESVNPGALAVQFNAPSLSGTTSPFLLAPPPGTITPNISAVTQSASDSGVQSLRVSWQFKDALPQDWLRLVAQGSGNPNPQLDLRLPITFRILVLPVGQTPQPVGPIFVSGPGDQNTLQGGTVTLSTVFHATGPVSYQWRRNGIAIPDATGRNLTLTNLQASDAGTYTLEISNVVASAVSPPGQLTVSPVVTSGVMTPLWRLAPGARPYLTNDNNQRGLAYNPVSGNLLLVSRTPSNAVHVLDGTTGAHIRTLDMDPSVINDPSFAVNMIACSDMGEIFVCNLTTNGTTAPLKIYQWIDEEFPPQKVWEGDPGVGTAERWGDSFDLRGSGPEVQILVGSRAGTIAAFILPLFGGSSSAFVIQTDAPAGGIGASVAFGTGDTFWGKSLGNSLRHFSFDLGVATATTLQSFNGFLNMGPLGFDAGNNLLAGVFIESPDNLRLLDASVLPQTPVIVDTEFFGTDNPNPNAYGQVAFGPNVVYALDSNNGILAMSFNPSLIAPSLSFSRNGDTLTLTWSGSAMLQSSSTVDGTYNNVNGATSPYPVSVLSSPMMYYRLKK